MRKVCSTPGTSVARTRMASTSSPAASKVRFHSHMYLFIAYRVCAMYTYYYQIVSGTFLEWF